MKARIECIPCNISSLIKVLGYSDISMDERENLIKEYMLRLSKMENGEIPVLIGREMGLLLKEVYPDLDLYHTIKKESNDYLLSIYDELKEMVLRTDDPIKTAIRLTVAGNIIDIAPGHKIDIDETMKKAIETPFAIDHTDELLRELFKAERILYIGDNCGEIVLDKLFLDIAGLKNVDYVVRSLPVLNDVTKKEALEIGLNVFATIIEGSDAPGALINYSSHEFKELYNNSDVIIAKGQGNFEGLSDEKANIYFLLMAKCEVIARYMGVKKGDFLVLKSGGIKYDDSQRRQHGLKDNG